jgi:phosphoribosylformylglycinamidine (FGAM) synthase-like enzyme
VDGIAAACEALGVPVVSGNVSLYNETDRRPILPTPTVAVVGLLRNLEDQVTQWFKGAGDVVLLLGGPSREARATGTDRAAGLGGSEYLYRKLGRLAGPPPAIDLGAEVKLQKLVLGLAREHRLRSAHDVSEGGLAVALAECCTTSTDRESDVGARIDLETESRESQDIAKRTDVASVLFGEHPTRVIVSVGRDDVDRVRDASKVAGVPCGELGVTGGTSLSIALVDRHAGSRGAAVLTTEELRRAREGCLASIVGE